MEIPCSLDRLPSELIQHVLLHCSTPSFLLAIRTCKILFSAASSNRELILHHLKQVPGITLGLRDSQMKNKDLFTILRKRGYHHLYGISLTADCFRFSFQHEKIDSNASSIIASPNGIDFALVLKGSSDLWLLPASKDSYPRLLRIECPYVGDTSIAKVKTRGPAVSVLYKTSIERNIGLQLGLNADYLDAKFDEEDDKLRFDPPVSEAHLDSEIYRLVHFDYFNSVDRYFTVIAPSPVEGNVLIPVDITLWSQLQCAILWDLPDTIIPSRFLQIVSYSAEKSAIWSEGSPTAEEFPVYDVHRLIPVESYKKDTFDRRRPHPDPQKNPFTTPLSPPLPPPIVSLSAPSRLSRAISFIQSGRNLKIYLSGSIIPNMTIRSHPMYRGKNQTFPASTPTYWSRRINFVDWDLTIPFFAFHEMKYPPSSNDDDSDDNVRVQECILSSLCLATASVSSSIVPRYKYEEDEYVKILCLIRAVDCVDADDCNHVVDTEVCQAQDCEDPKIVARLWGWNASNSSFAGESILATSKYGERLAIADWDRILVYSIDPKALIDKSQDGDETSDGDGYQVPFWDARDHGDRERKTSSYYEKVFDANLQTWIVELRPIVLLSGGVVRELIWKSVDELLVRTDRGVQLWDLSVNGTGKRSHCFIDKDTAEDEINWKYQ